MSRTLVAACLLAWPAASKVVAGEAMPFARSFGPALLPPKERDAEIRGLADLERPGLRLVLAAPAEPGARALYLEALAGLLGAEAAGRLLAHEVAAFPGRLGIQHRDVPMALAAGYADAGIILRHLALYYAHAFPERFAALELPGAERYSATIALATVRHPRHARAAAAFAAFLLARAREVYPRYGFAVMDAAAYGKRVPLAEPSPRR